MAFEKNCDGFLVNCLLCGRSPEEYPEQQCTQCLNPITKFCGQSLLNLQGNKDLCSECAEVVNFNLKRKKDTEGIENLKNITE